MDFVEYVPLASLALVGLVLAVAPFYVYRQEFNNPHVFGNVLIVQVLLTLFLVVIFNCWRVMTDGDAYEDAVLSAMAAVIAASLISVVWAYRRSQVLRSEKPG